jgi:methyltransferase-like protein/cyclopropane fatty-acyl-phospholipid synthase-like methyltransferase
MNMSAANTNANPTDDSYDEVPYPGGAFRPTHPSHIAMVARLCGLTPPSPRKCRVLELGSSMGWNLIPMAQDSPDSTFVGIDLSARQIEEGQAAIKELGLKNIELRHLSITDVDGTFGKFDYIICHGVYSWVPHDVQEKILKIGAEHLTPNGVMYVSYNTYPGWHLRGVVREMMRYHVADFDTPQMKIRQARGLLEFLLKYSKSHSLAYTQLLKDEAAMLEGSLDSYLYHEHLEEVNEPLYFHQFVRRADSAGLRYLADSHISSMVAQLFDDSAAEILRGAPMLRREQYMDFLRSRMFRSSLLCHPNLDPNYSLPSSNLAYMHVSLNQQMAADYKPNGETVWKHPAGTLTTEGPVTKVIETLNGKFPVWMSVKELTENLDAKSKNVVMDSLLMGLVHGVARLSEEPATFSDIVSEKPICTAVSRYQAARGNRVTGRLHNDWMLQPQQRFLVELLDGTRTAEELASLLHAEVTAGRFKVTKEGQNVAPDLAESVNLVKAELQRLRNLALLVDEA